MPDQNYSATVNANGNATIRIQSRPRSWSVGQVNVEMPNAPVGAVCTIRKNGGAGIPVAAARDVASGDPYVELTPSDVMTIEWEGCTPGDVGQAFVIYNVVR